MKGYGKGRGGKSGKGCVNIRSGGKTIQTGLVTKSPNSGKGK